MMQFRAVLNAGIVGMEVYFPKRYISQQELEKHYGYPEGKITIGLGQNNMAVCDDREDINSICMTVAKNCLDKYGIPPHKIGRLEVGTETLIDKAKSVKTVLMQLFQDCNSDIEGVDNVNACYGGTGAVLNSINWVESSSWDGRYALVVTADIAIYDEGPARPSGGAGAVAILIGPDAPIIIEKNIRASHMEHVYDFYKPLIETEFPHVDGKLSLTCYLRAFDKCYSLLMKKYELAGHKAIQKSDDIDYCALHSPFYKLVIKATSRMIYNDYLSKKNESYESAIPELKTITQEDSYTKKEFLDALVAYGKKTGLFDNKVVPTASIAKELGNSYSASVWLCLSNILSSKTPSELLHKSILVFSYGSGFTSSAFVLRVIGSTEKIHSILDINKRLESRTLIETKEYINMIEARKCTFKPDYVPKGRVTAENYFHKTFYLEKIDDQYRRTYKLFD